MKTITVKGIGNVSVKPDWIIVSMKLETEDKEYDKTTELAAERITIITISQLQMLKVRINRGNDEIMQIDKDISVLSAQESLFI